MVSSILRILPASWFQRAITGLWAMRGSKRRNFGGCQVRPLTPILKVYSSFTIFSTRHKKGKAECAVNRRIFQTVLPHFYQDPNRITKCCQRGNIRRIELGILALHRFLNWEIRDGNRRIWALHISWALSYLAGGNDWRHLLLKNSPKEGLGN